MRDHRGEAWRSGCTVNAAMSTALVLVSTKAAPAVEDEGLPQRVVTPRRIRKAYTSPPYAPRPVVTIA